MFHKMRKKATCALVSFYYYLGCYLSLIHISFLKLDLENGF